MATTSTPASTTPLWHGEHNGIVDMVVQRMQTDYLAYLDQFRGEQRRNVYHRAQAFCWKAYGYAIDMVAFDQQTLDIKRTWVAIATMLAQECVLCSHSLSFCSLERRRLTQSSGHTGIDAGHLHQIQMLAYARSWNGPLWHSLVEAEERLRRPQHHRDIARASLEESYLHHRVRLPDGSFEARMEHDMIAREHDEAVYFYHVARYGQAGALARRSVMPPQAPGVNVSPLDRAINMVILNVTPTWLPRWRKQAGERMVAKFVELLEAELYEDPQQQSQRQLSQRSSGDNYAQQYRSLLSRSYGAHFANAFTWDGYKGPTTQTPIKLAAPIDGRTHMPHPELDEFGHPITRPETVRRFFDANRAALTAASSRPASRAASVASVKTFRSDLSRQLSMLSLQRSDTHSSVGNRSVRSLNVANRAGDTTGLVESTTPQQSVWNRGRGGTPANRLGRAGLAVNTSTTHLRTDEEETPKDTKSPLRQRIRESFSRHKRNSKDLSKKDGRGGGAAGSSAAA